MADVTLNSAVRSNLRTLQSTTTLMNRTEQRLSTGRKVNSAFDNPGSFFTSQSLDRRASDLNSLLDNVSSSTKTLQAAGDGLTSISQVVSSLKATARSALQSPSAVATKAKLESSAIAGLTEDNLLGASGAIAPGTLGYPGPSTALLGSVTGLTSATTLGSLGGAGSYTVRVAPTTGNGGIAIYTSNATTIGSIMGYVNQTATVRASLSSDGRLEFASTDSRRISLTGSTTNFLTGAGFAASAPASAVDGKTLTVTDRSGAAKTLTLSASGVNTLDELNGWLADNDVALTASVSTSGGSGKLKLETLNADAARTPADIAGTIADAGGAFAAGKSFSAPSLDAAAAARRAAFVRDYNDALKQIATLARDASFNGVNLLDGDDLDVAFNEDGSSALKIKGVSYGPGGLGLSDLSATDFNDASSIDDVLGAIDGAVSEIERRSSKFGSQLQIVSTRQSFTKAMTGTLEDGSLALTSADTNLEASHLATLKTRQQLIVSALSISSGQEQNILQLLR